MRLAQFFAATALFWALAAVPAGWFWGVPALAFSGAAAVICTIPGALTLWWADRVYRQSPDQQLVMVLGGTGLRLFAVLGGSYSLYQAVPYFQTDTALGFWTWVGAFYLFTLAAETLLSVAGRNTETTMASRDLTAAERAG
jgi:hypothetical protein